MALSDEQLRLLQTAFRPHAAIEDPGSFFGRIDEKARVREAISDPGLQVVVYGEPGCGKTSLANVATEGFPRIKVFCEKDSDFARILRDTAMEIQKLDPKRIVYDAEKDTISMAGIVLPLGKLTGNNLLTLLPNKEPFCVILDELDRVKDGKALESIAELVKNVATNRPNLTIVMVGVADTADEVLKGHASNFRNIREVQLDRMDEEGLRGILDHGGRVLAIKFAEEVKVEILQLCNGMPYYLHLLAKQAARAALTVGSPVVDIDDLSRGAIEAAGDADQQLRNAYEHAIISEEGSRIFQRIVWAMANLSPKSNSVADISAEANLIATRESNATETPQAIGVALEQLASEKKGRIVYQPIAGAYRFTSPLMKGFIRLVRLRR